MNISIAAQRAATSRRFRNAYGENVRKVVRRLMLKQPTSCIASDLNMSRRTVAAIAANFTRGTYGNFVDGNHWR